MDTVQVVRHLPPEGVQGDQSLGAAFLIFRGANISPQAASV